MFGRKINQNNSNITPPSPPANHGLINPPLSSSLDFTNQTHSSGPQQLTSVRIKESFGKIFVFFTTFSLLATIAFTGYMFLSKKNIENDVKNLTTQKDQLMAEYEKPQNTKLISNSQDIVDKLKDLDKVLNKRIEWTKILKEFNRETFKNTVYSEISITADGAMQLKGQTPDKASFAKLYRAWESSEIVESVKVNDFEEQTNGSEESTTISALGIENFISFSLSLTLKPNLIYPKSINSKPDTAVNSSATTTSAQSNTTTQPVNH